MAELTVVACPEKHLAFTNFVYCAPADFSQLFPKPKRGTPSFLLINDRVVYTVEAHDKINSGELGLSALQRETLKVPQAGRVSVKPWALPTPAAHANLVKLSLNVELTGSARKTVTEKELSEYLSDNFNNAMLNVGQSFIVDYVGTPLKLTVKDLSVPSVTAKNDNNDGIVARASRGVLVKDVTELDIDSEPVSKFFNFVKEKKKSFLPQNFRFEDMGIGGLDAEFNLLFRRAFASRIFPQKLVQQLGIKHVKGMLLYGAARHR